jgi:hypothetical protein
MDKIEKMDENLNSSSTWFNFIYMVNFINVILEVYLHLYGQF